MEVQMRIVFLCMVIISSDTQEVMKNLTGTEGGSITLPDPVVELGFLSFGRKTIAMVNERKVKIYEEIHKDKVLWNNNTGNFTITGLQRNDSGIYHIESKTGRVFTASYKLTVYESVPPPAVDTLYVTAESCTLLCSVKNETTLSWYRDEEIVNRSSSTLSLPLTVHKQDFNFSYRCVAANPAEEKTLPVNVTTSCDGQNNTEPRARDHTIGIVIPIVSAVIVILVAFIIKRRFDKNKRTTRHTQDSVNREPEALYTVVHISENRRRQGGNLPDRLTADGSNLTTVYDKLEAHRIVPSYIDTADHVRDHTVD